MHCAAHFGHDPTKTSDSEYSDDETIDLYSRRTPRSLPPLMASSLMVPGNQKSFKTGMELYTNTTDECVSSLGGNSLFRETTSLVNTVVDKDILLRRGSASLLKFLSSSYRMFWFFMLIFLVFIFYPLTCIVITGCLALVFLGGHPNGESPSSNRTARWTITGFSYQMKDGFLTSPPFQDKSGQWRMVVKQKRNLEGMQTSLGLLCTDMSKDVETVSVRASFQCTNCSGHELSVGGSKSTKIQHEYHQPGDCGYSRNFRLAKNLLGGSETLTVHCNVEFQRNHTTCLKTLAQKLLTADESSAESGQNGSRKGRNVVPEAGQVIPINMDFPDECQVPREFRPAMRFVKNSETRTFLWEIPDFYNRLENVDLWGIYSPQFFVNFSQDATAIWRLKLVEVEGVFRLHVQLRGLPHGMKQVKLWYLLQLVDMYGDSVIPEYAASRLKYPDYMNLWETTRHILYRRELILDRFVGGLNSGTFSIRISVQMQANDLSLMGADSDDWIQRPSCGIEAAVENPPNLALPSPTGNVQAYVSPDISSPGRMLSN